MATMKPVMARAALVAVLHRRKGGAMFESLQGNNRRGAAERLPALLASVGLHGLMLVLLVVLPLLFLRVLPGSDLLTFVIAPPPPVPEDVPAPPPDSVTPQGNQGGIPMKPIDYVPPDRIPQGIQAPGDETLEISTVVGIYGSRLGLPGMRGPAGSGVPAGLIGVAPPPIVPPPPRPPGPSVVRVGGTVQEAKLIRRVLPVYPDITKRARISGTVILEVTIDEEGNVSDVKVLRGHVLLVEEAVRAVKEWKYSPTLLNGEPVAVVSNVTVIFQLK
jgi:protein TonB